MSYEFPPYINKTLYEKFLERQVAKCDIKLTKLDFVKAQREIAAAKLEEYRNEKKKQSKK